MIASTSALFQRVNRGEIPPRAVHVHAETEHIAIGHDDADEVRRHGLGPACVFLSEHGAVELGRARRHELRPDRGERVTFIEYVVDDKHHASGDRGSRTYFPADLAPDGAAA